MNLDGGGEDRISSGLGCLPVLHLPLNHDFGCFSNLRGPTTTIGVIPSPGNSGEGKLFALAPYSLPSPWQRPRAS